MVVHRFEELQVWQKARAFNRVIYSITRRREFVRDPSFVSQIRRASLSVMNNIAEGFERHRRKEFLQYLSTAKASCGEVRSMIYAAVDIGYLSEDDHRKLLTQGEEVGRILGGFRAGLERSPAKLRAS